MNLSTWTVAVVGLGPMGRGIARIFDRVGATVLVVDVSAEATEQGIARIRDEADKDGETVGVRAATLEDAAAHADLLIEAIVENMAAKDELLAVVRKHGRRDLVVASNTSSLSVGQMGHAFGDPGRLIGLHFFNPPTKMRLVEVIRGAATSDDVHELAVQIVEALGKTPVSCGDSPNFVVNRICRPLYYEAQLLVAEGLEPAVVDAVARGALGHRMGPLQLLDFTGLHTHLASSETAYREFGDPRYRPIPRVRQLVRNGMTGRAAGRGFYEHEVESARDAIARVTRTADAGAPVPCAASDVVVYPCHRPPTVEDAEQVRRLAANAKVVVDSSDAGWSVQLPEGAAWVRLHSWRDRTFAEVVDDAAAGVPAPVWVDDVLDAWAADSVRVLALPGLVADRLANCLANEAYAVVEEGTAGPDDVNTALRLAMNHPQGPLEYVDRVGVTTVHAGLRSMLDAFGDPRYRPAQLMRRHASAATRSATGNR